MVLGDIVNLLIPIRFEVTIGVISIVGCAPLFEVLGCIGQGGFTVFHLHQPVSMAIVSVS